MTFPDTGLMIRVASTLLSEYPQLPIPDVVAATPLALHLTFDDKSKAEQWAEQWGTSLLADSGSVVRFGARFRALGVHVYVYAFSAAADPSRPALSVVK